MTVCLHWLKTQKCSLDSVVQHNAYKIPEKIPFLWCFTGMKGGHRNTHCGLSSQVTDFHTNSHTNWAAVTKGKCLHSGLSLHHPWLSATALSVCVRLWWCRLAPSSNNVPSPSLLRCYLPSNQTRLCAPAACWGSRSQTKRKLCQQPVSQLSFATSTDISNPNNAEDYRSLKWTSA